MIKRIFFVVVLLGSITGFTPNDAAEPKTPPKPKFHVWLNQTIKPQALAQGMTPQQWEVIAKSIHFLPKVIKLDKVQPEVKKSWTSYRDSVVNPQRIAKGHKMIKQYNALLKKVSQDYGVPAEIIVALWGIETNYGQNTGGYYVPSSLATLAYDGRRQAFFTKELLIALDMLRQKDVSRNQFKGSWAGATGQCQFMPSSYQRYAVDYDHDGKKDIWHNHADIFASIANYLKSSGWNKSVSWGFPVSYKGSLQQQNFTNHIRSKKPLEYWVDIGIKISRTSQTLDKDQPMTLLAGSSFDNDMFLVYNNFFVLREWNKSDYFCLAVGLLADALRSE